MNIKIQTPDGVSEYTYIRDSVEYEKALAAGEISEGMDIVYRSFLVHIIHDGEMLVLTPISQLDGMAMWTFMNGGVQP